MSSKTKTRKVIKPIKLKKPKLPVARPVGSLADVLGGTRVPLNPGTKFTVKIKCTSNEFQLFTKEMQDQAKVDMLIKRLNTALSSTRHGYEIKIEELEIDVQHP